MVHEQILVDTMKAFPYNTTFKSCKLIFQLKMYNNLFCIIKSCGCKIHFI